MSSISKKPMDKRTYENWVRIKDEFELSGNIEAAFYKRACEIVRTREDPFSKYGALWEKAVHGGSSESKSSENETSAEDS